MRSIASSTWIGFCDDDAESRYTRRFPCTCRLRIGKSDWMRAMSRSFMSGRFRSGVPAVRPRLRCSSCRGLTLRRGAERVETFALHALGHLSTTTRNDAPVEQHVHAVGSEVPEDPDRKSVEKGKKDETVRLS